MPRKVALAEINSELRIKTSGITIRLKDGLPRYSGRLRIGKANLVWTPKFKQIDGPNNHTKTWEELIEFFRG